MRNANAQEPPVVVGTGGSDIARALCCSKLSEDYPGTGNHVGARIKPEKCSLEQASDHEL